MRILELSDNTSYERQWTTAVSIFPSSHVVRWSCPNCGRAENYPSRSFGVKIEGGTAYPDVLGCGAFPLLIVSERVLSSWKQHDVGPIAWHSVKVLEAIETALTSACAPNYFRVQVGGSIKVDIPGSGGRISEFCGCCGGFRTEPMLIKRFAFLPGSWDGSELFSDKQFFPNVVFCTDRVKSLAESESHTNFRFAEMMPLTTAGET